ncbi:glutamyl-tRNA amidotransferase [Mycobacterium sp.]|uniref:glutamyl-tRNA amidotransferase n=1 Tax=Mycobacterium sp. TaxID=1785 RepID=UPI002D91D28E|nr:glutamyl-tRNA amidotransferase [Mycobacterium sp.]
MTPQPADQWRTKLHDALLTARKDRDTMRTSALRSALSAIDNAGAVPTATLGTETPDGAQVDGASSGTIAGAVTGLGGAEVARRQLSDTQIRALLRAEVDDRMSAADAFTAGGHPERATTLREEAAVLTDLLGNV